MPPSGGRASRSWEEGLRGLKRFAHVPPRDSRLPPWTPCWVEPCSEWGVRGPRGRSHPVFPHPRSKDGRDVCVGSSLSETDAAGTISGPRAHREEPVARACAAAGTPESRPEPWARGSQKREFSPYQEVTAESAVKRVTSVNRVCSKYYHIHRYQHGNRCERDTLHPF